MKLLVLVQVVLLERVLQKKSGRYFNISYDFTCPPYYEVLQILMNL